MTFRGTFHNGKVILEDGASLPEGTRVRVEPVRARAAKRRVKPTRRRKPATAKKNGSSGICGERTAGGLLFARRGARPLPRARRGSPRRPSPWK